MKRTIRPVVALIAVMAFGLIPVPAPAAPREDLLRLVPADATLCVVVNNLRDGLSNSPALERLADLPVLKSRRDSAEVKQLLAIYTKVLKDLDLTDKQLRDELLGDACVFAFRHAPAEKAEAEEGIFLIWARDKALLARVVDRINELQVKAGELKEVRSIAYRDSKYTERVKSNNNRPEFYLIREHILVLSNHENSVTAAIDRLDAGPNKAPMLFWENMLKKLGLEKVIATVLVNPRSFDRELQDQEKAAPISGRAFLKEFRRYWDACAGLGIYIDASRYLEFGLAVQIHHESLPRAAQQFFADLGRPSALWKSIPEDALFALAARTNLTALAELFAGFCEDSSRKEMLAAIEVGLRPFMPDNIQLDALLKGVGPDWGFWAARPEADDKADVPRLMFALALAPTPEGKAVETMARNAVQFLTTIAQFSAKDGLRVETVTEKDFQMRVLSHDTLLPNGFKPTFAVKDGYLLFSGSPENVRKFAPPAPIENWDEATLLRISAAGWTKYLTEQRTAVAALVGKAAGLDTKNVEAKIDAIVPNLRAIDRLEVAVRGKGNVATVTLRIKMANNP